MRLYRAARGCTAAGWPEVSVLDTFHGNISQNIRSRQWAKAPGLIEQCRKISGSNRELYDLHLTPIAWHEANPPLPDWDGGYRQPLR